MNTNSAGRIISRRARTLTIKAEREASSARSVVDLGTRVVDVFPVNVDHDRTSEVTIRIEQLVTERVVVTEERIVGRDQHRRKRDVAVRRRIDDADVSSHDGARSNRSSTDLSIETTRLQELTAQNRCVTGLCENLETFGGALAAFEEIEITVVKASPDRREEETISWLKVLDREKHLARFGVLRSGCRGRHGDRRCEKEKGEHCSPYPSSAVGLDSHTVSLLLGIF